MSYVSTILREKYEALCIIYLLIYCNTFVKKNSDKNLSVIFSVAKYRLFGNFSNFRAIQYFNIRFNLATKRL